MPFWLVCCIVSVVLWGVWQVVFSAVSAIMPPLLIQVLATLGLFPVVAALAFSKQLMMAQRLWRGVAYGLVTGFCGTLGNVALSYALVRGGEASTVGPLTAMFPLVTIILACVFLKERLNRVQVVGIALAVMALYLFNAVDARRALEEAPWWQQALSPWMASALVALFLWGIAGVTQKLSTNDISNELSTISYWAAAVAVGLGLLATQSFEWRWPVRAWCLVLGSGVILGLALWVGFAAYRGGKASVVTALIALYPVVTVALAVPLLDERIDLKKGIAIVLALLAGLALTYERPAPREGKTGMQ